MNPFLLSKSDRLQHWKTFRNSLPQLSEEEQLKAVACYWSKAPLRSIARDIYSPDTWPTIWEMINDGDWCRDTIAIGMEETLRLSGWDTDRLDMRYVLDQEHSHSALVVVCDSKWFLNFEWGTVVPKPKGLRSLYNYAWDGRSFRSA